MGSRTWSWCTRENAYHEQPTLPSRRWVVILCPYGGARFLATRQHRADRRNRTRAPRYRYTEWVSWNGTELAPNWNVFKAVELCVLDDSRAKGLGGAGRI